MLDIVSSASLTRRVVVMRHLMLIGAVAALLLSPVFTEPAECG
jgi:hypothetical protein